MLCSIKTLPAHTVAPAEIFVTQMGNKAFASLGEKGISQEEKTSRFRAILKDDFDIPRIARFTLGRYWRTATYEQKKVFIRLFEKFFVQAYTNRFQDLSGKQFRVIRSRKISKTQWLVLSHILTHGKPAIKVNWRVRKNESEYKIVDVVVEGISMSVTQRDEFVSVVRQMGGKVAGLLRALRKKTLHQ